MDKEQYFRELYKEKKLVNFIIKEVATQLTHSEFNDFHIKSINLYYRNHEKEYAITVSVISDIRDIAISNTFTGKTISEALSNMLNNVINDLSETVFQTQKLEVTSIIVSDIDWDCDVNIKKTLPKTIEINYPDKYLLEDIDGYADNLLNKLSDEYGYCIRNLNIDVIKKAP